MAASGPSRGHARLRVGELKQSRSLALGSAPWALATTGAEGVGTPAFPPRPPAVPWPQVHVAPVSSRHPLLRCRAALSVRASRTRLVATRVYGPAWLLSRVRRGGGSAQQQRVCLGAPVRCGCAHAHTHNTSIRFPTSDRTRLPAEFKHITKRRKRN